MNCDILKIVRGNDFATQMTITALDAGGNVIEDFSLEDSTEVVVKYTLAGNLHTIEAYDYDIEGNDITIQWSDLALGKYGFEIEGKFNGYSWRSAARFIFQIVADNASANIPDGVLVNGIYILNDWLRLLSGTGGGIKQVQADWTETDTEAPSYIQHKPELAPVATSGSYNDLTNKPTIPDVTGKADKVSGAVAGDFAGLDANGNITDSGKKASDFATAAQGAKADTAIQDISGKQDVLVSGTNIKTINNESILGSGNIDVGGDVESVNGQTGVVVLDAEDVGAASAEDLQDVAADVATNTQDIENLQAAYAGLTQSDIVPLTSLPASGVANTIYRIAGTNSYTDYMWNGTEFIPMATYTIPPDAGVYDISAEHSGATYDNLTAALGASGANVPEGVRAGGMSVKYLENVYADYSVVVTEGLTTEPTGTLLESAPTITDGTYKAAQLSAFATLPANPYNSVTYYIGVTEDETTTYTSWVITKKTNDSTKYVQCRLMSAAWSANVDDWQIDVMHELDERAGETKLISIPFDVNKRLINSNGTLGSNNSWKGTAYVPVNAGEEWYYSGLSGTSLSVYGYSYDGSTYTPIKSLIGKTSSLAKNYYFVIPNNVTHIVASCKTSNISDAALTCYKDSYLGELMNALGDVRKVEVVPTASWTNGRYVGANGTWYTSNSFGYMFLDVMAGQTIFLKSISTRPDVATIAKKITDTKNEVLYISESEAWRDVRFGIEEDMTIVISATSSGANSVVLITEKFKRIDNQIEVLQEKQVADEAEHLWQAQYDLRLGYMFNGIAVIGDSMSVGSISTQDVSEPNSNLGASWLSVLAKRWGCVKRQHYARGGTTSYSWLNNTEYGLGKMLNDANVYNAYFIAYAHNDAGSSSISSVGAATDTAATVTISGTTPSCASGNTFCAYYKAIIDQIRTKAPNAMIFLMSSYDNVVRNNSSHRNAIKNIASWYYEQGDHLVYALDTGGVPDSEMSLGGHYSTQGYFHIAMRADQEANKVIYEHRSDIQVKEFGYYNNVNASYLGYVTQ